MKTRVDQYLAVILVSIALVMLGMPGCDRRHKLNLKSEYQAVFLSNGQAFIGKIEGAGTDYPLLTDVFYIESRVDPQTKQVTNILVKRGKELHSPEFMYINARNILMIEPVGPDSKVAKLIKEATAQKNGGGTK
jgi:hypothetical protein